MWTRNKIRTALIFLYARSIIQAERKQKSKVRKKWKGNCSYMLILYPSGWIPLRTKRL
jgi:hypothetical protein